MPIDRKKKVSFAYLSFSSENGSSWVFQEKTSPKKTKNKNKNKNKEDKRKKSASISRLFAPFCDLTNGKIYVKMKKGRERWLKGGKFTLCFVVCSCCYLFVLLYKEQKKKSSTRRKLQRKKNTKKENSQDDMVLSVL